ncbi:ATP-binding protein [Streptomyces sp. NPDC020707]|uniref:ATP-binding protein n=1 Tax=Streptomyces sp. NPDC020707 TaxID=3365084 RepID=UPI0037BA3FF8
MKTIFLQPACGAGESTTSSAWAHQVVKADRMLAGEEKRPMNVQYLTRRGPGCLAVPSAVMMPEGSTALLAQGVCAVTEIPLHRHDMFHPGEPQFEASFPAEQAAIPPVRRRLRARLAADGLEGVADDVALISQELMANGILHGCRNLPPGTTVKITVAWSDDRLRVDVHDPSDRAPMERKPSVSRTSGRGLALVDGFFDRWGVELGPVGSGKAVWAELDSPRRRTS